MFTAVSGYKTWIAVTVVFLLSALGAVIMNSPLLAMALPAVLITGVLLLNPSYLFILLFTVIPLSIEFYYGSLGSDLPSEPLMWLISFFMLLVLVRKPDKIKAMWIYHPATLILIAVYLWIVITTIWSDIPLISAKFLAAKTWYLLTFFLFSLYILENYPQVLRSALKLCTAALTVTILYTLYNHSQSGFSFAEANYVMQPFFRNHVNYACIQVVLLPFIFYLRATSERKWIYNFLILIFILGIFFSYTRAAWLSIVVGTAAYFFIQWNVLKELFLTAVMLIGIVLGWLIFDNQYLEYPPDFERAITYEEFDNLLAATTKGEDASTQERFYRWIAARYMVEEKPYLGFGPGTFYSSYKPYTVSSFRTWVSGNPEGSGIHNYYFMTAVEQGFFGLFIFLLLMYSVLSASQFYINSEGRDPLVLASVISFVIIGFIQVMNDLIETDKIGSFFYLCVAIVVFKVSQKKFK